MTQEQFIYWLQGKLEGKDPHDITWKDIVMIQDHLKTVFHKVTPTYPPQPVPMPHREFPGINPFNPNGQPPTVIC